MYFSGSEKAPPFPPSTRKDCCASPVRATPHRTQRSRNRSTPAAAADSGLSAFDTSTHAQTFSVLVTCATKDNASAVRPEHSAPIIWVNAPIGSPPSSTSSTVPMPVGATGRRIRGAGVSADGILSARTASICARKAKAEAIYSPYLRLPHLSIQLPLATEMVQ